MNNFKYRLLFIATNSSGYLIYKLHKEYKYNYDKIYKNNTLKNNPFSILKNFEDYNKKINKNINEYTYEEIETHNNKIDRIWVTYKKDVFDITDFVENHPGGQSKIMLAAGKSIEPYWNEYKQHTNDDNIFKTILLPMKIGEISNYNPDKYKSFRIF